MCYAKPGPRCSNHVKKDIIKINKKIEQDPSKENKEQRRILIRDYDSTPEGQKALEVLIQRTNDVSATAEDSKSFDESREKIQRLKMRHSAGENLRQQKMAAHDVVHGTSLYKSSNISKAAFAVLPESVVKDYRNMVQEKVSEVASRTKASSVEDKNIKTLLEYATLKAGSRHTVNQYLKTGRLDKEAIDLVTIAYQKDPQRLKAHQKSSPEIDSMRSDVNSTILSAMVNNTSSKELSSSISPKITNRFRDDSQGTVDDLLAHVKSIVNAR